MTHILHLSDLHIVQNANWNNIRTAILEEANKVSQLSTDEKLLVITGDFHNFGEKTYDNALDFLRQLIDAMDIDPTEDLFVIPGNHDVGNEHGMKECFPGDKDWDIAQERAVQELRKLPTADKNYRRFLSIRIKSFAPYCRFLSKLGIYSDTELENCLPATPHVRCWRNKLNILHLNTALVADGKKKDNQQVDLLAATGEEIWKDVNQSLPGLALGHNNFFDLGKAHRDGLKPVFLRHGVCAYLCGDSHKQVVNSEHKRIFLTNNASDGNNDIQIPNVVGVKGAADDSDNYSDFGLYWHDWDPDTGNVTLRLLEWRRQEDQASLSEGTPRNYPMPRTERLPHNCAKTEPDENTSFFRFLSMLLEKDIDDHPSFKLMRPDDLDRDLLPRFQDAKLLPALGSIGEGDISPVWDLIAKSWQDGRNHSIVLEGEGGIGKTVALLSPEGEEAKSVPALYIPLFELVSDEKVNSVEHYLKGRLGAYWVPFEKLACASWNNKPSLLLLLDGVNELPVQHRFPVVSSIKNWAKDRPGVQVVAVSRPLSGMKLEDELPDALSVRLAPVGVETVKTYLCKLGREIPPDNDPLWEVLRLPLFLVLYAKTGKLDGKTVCGYPLAPRPESGKGAVIWNYLQRELMRRNEEDWVLRCAVACEYLLPAVGYEMVKNSRFTIGKDVLDRIIRQALPRLPQSLPRHLRTLFDVYDDIHEEPPDFAGVKWRSMLIHELGLLTGYREERNTYTFLHQHFRDAFAGLYLVNAAEAEPGLPELWQHAQPPLALDYAAPLMGEEDAAALWSALPRQTPVSRETLYVQLELQRRRRGGDYSHLDFSGMDLRGISLARYGKGLFRNPAYARGTRLNKAVFSGVGHSKPVSCVAALRDGRFVSGSEDNTLRVWDSYTGDCLRVLEGHTRAVTCVTALPDGRIVSGSDDETLRVWREGKDGDWACRELEGHASWVRCVAALPDGRIVSGSWDKTLRVWREGKDGNWESRELKGHTHWVNCVTVLRDGRMVSGSADRTLRVWREGKDGDWESRELEGHTNMVNCVTALPDGRIVSGSHDETLRVWREGKDGNWESRKLEGHNHWVNCVAALPDGRIVSGAGDKTLRVWDSGTGDCLRVLEGHTGEVECVTALPDGRMVSGSWDNTLRFWSPEGGNALDCLGQMSPDVNAAAVLNGNRWVSAHRDGTLRLWDGGCGRFLHLLRGHSEAVTCIAKLPDGRIVSGSDDETLRVWREGKDWSWKSRELEGHTGLVTCVTALPDGRIVSGSYDKTLRVWREGKDGDWESRELEGDSDTVDCVTALPDGRMVSGSNYKTLCLWREGKDGSWKSLELEGHTWMVDCVTALRDGRMVSGSDDYSLRVWREGKDGDWESRELNGHTDSVQCVTTLRDGRIVSGSEDKTLRVWDSSSGSCLRVLRGHTDVVRAVTALENGRVLSGAYDCTLRVWDVDRGRCLAVIPVSEMDLMGLDFRHSPMDEETARLLYCNGAEVPEAYRRALEKELEE